VICPNFDMAQPHLYPGRAASGHAHRQSAARTF